MKNMTEEKIYVYIKRVLVILTLLVLLSTSLPIESIGAGISYQVKNMVKLASTNTEITTIDVTELRNGGTAAHAHIYEKKYDATNHWEECWICGDQINKVAHDPTEQWALDSSQPKCKSVNYCILTCSCGYSDRVTEPHTYNTDYNNKTGVESTTEQWIHYKRCTLCNEWAWLEPCKKSDGTRITCNNLGVCAYCGHNYNTKEHTITTENGNCLVCGMHFVDCNILDITYNSNHTTATIEMAYRLNNGATFNTGEANSDTQNPNNIYWYCPGGATVSSKEAFMFPLEQADNCTDFCTRYNINLTDKYQNIVNFQPRIYVNINGVRCRVHYPKTINLYRDHTPPTHNSITPTGNGTVNNYSKKAQVTASVNETYSMSVDMRLLDSDCSTVLADWRTATKNGTTFTHTFDVVAEIQEPKTVYVESKDLFGNTCRQSVQLMYIDAKAPTLTSNNNETPTQWSKSKQVTYTTQDQGIGQVKIGFNNQADLQLASQSSNNYSRTYNFIGDVYGSVSASLYLQDGLGNIRTERVVIHNIDNTAPTITNVGKTVSSNKKSVTLSVTANDINTKLNKSGSGIVGYAITQNNTAPSNYQTSNSFNIDRNGTYYMWAKDAVGNVSAPTTVTVNEIGINIEGNIIWEDSNNAYSTRLPITLKLYRKIGTGAEELAETKTIPINQTRYSFLADESNNAGQTYTYRIAQDAITGYTSTINGYNITNILNTYTVKYNQNNPDASHGIEVEGTTANTTHKYKATQNIASNNYTRNAHSFVSWNTKEDGTGDVRTNGGSYISDWTTKNNDTITLYAQWRLDTRNINGQVSWDDQNNKYTSRPENVQVTLNHDVDTVPIKAFPEEQNNPVTVAEDSTYSFEGVQDRKESNNTQYNYTVTQNLVPGYQTTTNGYNITNKLITPAYESSVVYTPIGDYKGTPMESYQNTPLKNGKIKIEAQITAKQDNQDKVGLHEGTVTFTIDNDITIDKSKTTINYYEAETNTTHKIDKPNYTIYGNTITVKFGKDQNGISHKNDKITIETEGTLNQIKTYTSNISLTGKLYDYRGTTQEGLNPQTNINLGEVTNTTQNLEVTEELPSTKLQIHIKAEDTNEALEGVKLQIINKNTKEVVKEWVSTKEDYYVEKLPAGEYILQQIEAPADKGYTKSDPIELEIRYVDEVLKIEMINKTAKLEISVIDKETKEPVTSAKVQIKNKETSEIVDEWISDKNVHHIKKLSAGEYILEQTEAPTDKGYVKAEPIEFKITATEELQQIQLEEDYTKLEVSIIDKETKEEVIGAKLQIKNKETGEVIDEWISDKEPHNIEKVPVGKYILQQTEAPNLRGYIKAEPIEFEIEETDELQQIQLEEEYTKVTINIVDPETKKPVIGATVVVKTEDGKEIATWTTTDKPYEVEKLPVGKYVVETKEAPYGYKAIKTTIEIEATDKIQEKNIENQRETFDIKVEKRISKIIRNGQETIVEGNDLKKIDIKHKKVNIENIQIEYTIKVTNEGKIEGTAGKIIEHIPDGLEFIASNNKEYWKEENGKIIADGLVNKTLKPGEYAELQIVLKWKNGTTNFGTKINKVTIEGQTNELNYKEKDDNNEATAEIIIGLSTGERNILYIAEAVLLSQILIAVVIIIKMYKKKI